MNGLHWSEGGIAFLLQGKSHQTVLDFALPCPFPYTKGPCDHRIDLNAQAPVQPFPTGELIDHMSPVPAEHPEVLFVTGPVPMTLTRMSSPVRLPIRPIWTLDAKQIVAELGRTNVQTLVLTSVSPDHRKKMDQVLEAAPFLPRKLLLHGTPNVILGAGARRVESMNVPEWLPWEAHGAHLLKQHMLRKP